MMLTAAIQPQTSCSIMGGVGLRHVYLRNSLHIVHNVVVIVGNHRRSRNDRMKTFAVASPQKEWCESRRMWCEDRVGIPDDLRRL